jgi:hypothetical protein
MTDPHAIYASILASQRRLDPATRPDDPAVLHLVASRSMMPLSQVRRVLNMDIQEMKR